MRDVRPGLFYSRASKARDEGREIPGPANPWPEMVALLLEAGPVMPGGVGEVPLSWSEIEAWCRMTGNSLTGREARLLRRLSIEYASEKSQATDPAHPCPWIDTEAGRKSSQSLAEMKRAFRGG